MIVTYIIILLTFLAALADKFIEKFTKNRRVLKVLKSPNVTLILLGSLMIFQIIDAIITRKEKDNLETQQNETLKNTIETKEKVQESQNKINSILLNFNNEIINAEKEIEMISNLNEEIKSIRQHIQYSIGEYDSLLSLYSIQIETEKEKIKNAKPDLRIDRPISLMDTVNFWYQFQFKNSGQRSADSIIFHSLMIFNDTIQKKSVVSLYKSNNSDLVALSLVGGNAHSYYANSDELALENVRKFHNGFLLVRYLYKDNMLDSVILPNVRIYYCSSFNKANIHYGMNIDTVTANNIKRYLAKENKMYYDIFFAE